jgi:AcrR family transcriptional regulator
VLPKGGLQKLARSGSRGNAGRPAASLHRDARELLLSAATELFATQGIAATTFAMIAKRASLTPAMLHYYFKDREQLLDAVVEERISKFILYVCGPVEPDGEAVESVRGVVDRLLEAIEKMPWIPSIWLREILNEDGLLRERVLPRLPYEKMRSVAKAIAAGQARKTLNSRLDPLLTVASTVSLVMLHTATIKTWATVFQREPLTKPAMKRHITALVLDGLRHHETETSAKSRAKRR